MRFVCSLSKVGAWRVAFGKGSTVAKLPGYFERTRCMYSVNDAMFQIAKVKTVAQTLRAIVRVGVYAGMLEY